MDIRAFYDTISQEWLGKFIEHRIGDRRLLNLIQKWMQAGVLEKGQWTLSEEGVPQGNPMSPVLANIYLPYVFDRWAQQWRKQKARGDMIMVRYADDSAPRSEDVRKYITVLTGVNFLVGLGDTIFLWYMGVDFALVWGLLAWFMGYIPSIGFLIALIPPVLMAYAQYGLQTALSVLVGYILINGGVENFYKPKVMGNKLRISPVVVFVGLFIWGYLLGGIGAILAVPMTMLVLLIMENFEGTRPVAILMRYTGEEKKEERQAAAQHVKGLWGTVKETIKPSHTPENKSKSK